MATADTLTSTSPPATGSPGTAAPAKRERNTNRLRDALVAAAIALATGLALALPGAKALEGWSIDSLYWLRERVLPAGHPAVPTAIIAIDEETYRTKPFENVPQAMWTPQLAKVLNATLDGGAKVVGFDVIYSTSIEDFIRGYERDWLLALRNAARSGRLVLGKVQHQEQPLLPHVAALRLVGEDNVRSLNTEDDADGIIRRLPLMLRTAEGGWESSFSLELAARGRGIKPELGPDGLRFDRYLVPGSRKGDISLRFRAGAIDVPTYSLADLNACAEAGDADYFRRAFADKIVLVGVVLDVEDRKLASKRFITGQPGVTWPERCKLPPRLDLREGAKFARDSIPGVYLHATAINNLLENNALSEVAPATRVAVTVGVALLAGVLAFWLVPWMAALSVVGLAVAWAAVATWAFAQSLVLPLLAPLVAAVATFGLQWGYRYAIADRDKRFLRVAFGHFLAPAVVDQLVRGEKPLELGGETRELTVLFSDVAKFSHIAEKLGDPHHLVEFMNKYLSEMTDIVEAHGGFVDKYIGDAIVAVFGAPLEEPGYARKAVAAALACGYRLQQIQKMFGLPPDLPVNARIGVNTGAMLVGNIGSRRRFNYTVMGDAVNLASRIEGANKAYGTYLLVSDSTRAACGEAFSFREIDTVRVVGRESPLTLYQPLIPQEADASAALHADYAQALRRYQGARFHNAAELFARIADRDAPARMMLVRCREFMLKPPPADWEGVFNLESK